MELRLANLYILCTKNLVVSRRARLLRNENNSREQMFTNCLPLQENVRKWGRVLREYKDF